MRKLLSPAIVASLVASIGAQEPTEAEQELIAKAKIIHAKAITLDTHKDISPTLALQNFPEDPDEREAYRRRVDPTVDGDNQVDFPKMRAGGYDVAFYIVYVGQGANDPGGFKRAKSAAFLKFDAIHRMAELYPEHIEIAYTPDDVRRIAGEGKLVACIGIENGYPTGEDLSLIAEFQKRGARYMSICHNRHSQLGDSHTPAEPLHGGLSDLGRKAIAEMNRVGIMVDISHAAKSTMMQTLTASKAPVIASHSGARAISDVTRNLDDEQLLAMKTNGGVVQAVALGSFVKANVGRREAVAALREELGIPGRRRGGRGRGRRGGGAADANAAPQLSPEERAKRMKIFQERMVEIEEKYPQANVKDFVDHIDHMVKLMGIDHVAISSDFDGGGGIQGWNNAAETFNVTLELVRRGYSEADINKIWSGNTLRVWAEVEAIASQLQAEGK
ncbi:MAG: dipeptidase [Planctomycetota bacterium]|jgi:microsomal dipeptidase-like Zn-dependent dipeptidase